MVKEKKKTNIWMILSFILIILYSITLIVLLHYTIGNKKIQISYNGVEYENEYTYVNLLIDNNTKNQIIFDKTNFSIKNTNISKTSSALYYENNVTYVQLTSSYILNNGEKIKIKLQFNKNDTTNETTIYFNGEVISKL